MNSADPDKSDDPLSEFLVAYDAALESGEPTAELVEENRETQPNLATHFEQAADCLELLEQVRQWGGSSRSADDSVDLELPGQGGDAPVQLGRFRILRELGRGGYGIVFLAVDPVLDRKVAVKVPKPGTLITPELRRRFLREAQAAAGLEHPNIVPVYEAADIGPVCYIAAAYCEGQTLRMRIDECEEPADPKESAEIVAALADAVHHAHTHGILHRDITPSNVMLEPSADGAGSSERLAFVPRLTDFGLAKVLETEEDQTRSGMILGTPYYMAPEQAEGRIDRISRRTDVYALGVVLYELLASRPPFHGETALETLQQVISVDPLPPRRRRREIPRDLEAICLKCLEKEPRHRYPDAATMSADLHRFLSGQSTLARPAGLWKRAVRWIRRRSAFATLLLVTVLAGAGIFAVRHSYLGMLEGARESTSQLRIEVQEHGALAHKRDERIQQFVYATDIKQAHQAWSDGDVGQTLALLDRHRGRQDGATGADFAWRFLWKLCHSDLATLRGHDGDVYTVTFSPDGKLLATAGRDGTARLWDAATRTPLRILSGHTDEVNVVTFSPDGKTVATGGDDGMLKLWDSGTGEELSTWNAHSGGTRSLAFSPNGGQLASGGHDRSVRIWELATGRESQKLEGHSGGVGTVAYSPDGTLLASGDSNHTTKIWDTASGDERRTLTGFRGNVIDVAFSPDGRTLAIADEDRTVALWDVGTGKKRADFRGHREIIQRLGFSPNGRLVVSASKDGTARVWDTATADLRNTFTGHVGRVWCAAFSADGRRVATSGADGSIKLWDVSKRTAARISPPAGLRLANGGMGISSDGTTFVLGTTSGALLIGNPREGGGWKALAGHSRSIQCLAISPGDNLLATAGYDSKVDLWNVPTREKLTTLLSDRDIRSVAFSPDGRLLATGSTDYEVGLWDVSTGQQRFSGRGHDGGVRSVAFSPDGRTLASVSYDGDVKMWDVATGRELLTLRGHTGGIFSVTFSPDGGTLATASFDRSIKIWDVSTSQELLVLRGHEGPVHSVAYSPDGGTLATGSADGHVKLWSMATGQEMIDLTAHEGAVHQVVFASRGHLLATAGETHDGQGEVYLWFAAADERTGGRQQQPIRR